MEPTSGQVLAAAERPRSSGVSIACGGISGGSVAKSPANGMSCA